MNANCIICSDLFQPRSDIYATSCGHLFHFVCLIQWIERSKTCPQCRHKETEKTIHRVYFNVLSSESIPDDVVTLQAKLDNENFQLKLKEKQRTNYINDYKKCSTNSRTLGDLTLTLQEKTAANRQQMVQMKEQLRYYKEKLKDKEKYAMEVRRLKSQIENMKNLKVVVDGREEEVEDLIKESRDPKTLCLFVAILQKELTEQDRQMQKLASQLRLNKSDYNEVRAQAFAVKKKYEELKKAQEDHINCPKKIAELKEKLAKLLAENDDVNPNDSINRAIFESPAPLRRNLNEGFVDEDANESPSINERVAQIKASDSPYLAVQSSVGGFYGHFLPAKYKIPKSAKVPSASNETADKYSIFHKKMTTGTSNGEYSYNGLGGHSKEDKFPQPKTSAAIGGGIKKSKTTTSNLKFKKLNPKAVSSMMKK